MEERHLKRVASGNVAEVRYPEKPYPAIVYRSLPGIRLLFFKIKTKFRVLLCFFCEFSRQRALYAEHEDLSFTLNAFSYNPRSRCILPFILNSLKNFLNSLIYDF